MKKLLSALILFTGLTMNGQQFDMIEATPAQKEMADNITEKLDSELGLTSKQEQLVSMNYAEFIAKRATVIKSTRSLKEKNDVLKALYLEQAKELNDVFTIYQRNAFKNIRSKYDPLVVIKNSLK